MDTVAEGRPVNIYTYGTCIVSVHFVINEIVPISDLTWSSLSNDQINVFHSKNWNVRASIWVHSGGGRDTVYILSIVFLDLEANFRFSVLFKKFLLLTWFRGHCPRLIETVPTYNKVAYKKTPPEKRNQILKSSTHKGGTQKHGGTLDHPYRFEKWSKENLENLRLFEDS